MGPRAREDAITPHTRPPADEDADHLRVRTVTCIDGSSRVTAALLFLSEAGGPSDRAD